MSHPFIDIYVLIENRNNEIVLEFLKEFYGEDIQNLEVSEVLLHKSPMTYETEWLEVDSILHAVEIGVENPNICFHLLLYADNDLIEWTSVMFSFDSKIILGLSIREFQDEESTKSNWDYAKDLKNTLITRYRSRLGIMGLEINFPRSESEMISLA